MMAEDGGAFLPVEEVATVQTLGAELLERLATKGRSRSTLEAVESHLRVHLLRSSVTSRSSRFIASTSSASSLASAEPASPPGRFAITSARCTPSSTSRSVTSRWATTLAEWSTSRAPPPQSTTTSTSRPSTSSRVDVNVRGVLLGIAAVLPVFQRQDAAVYLRNQVRRLGADRRAAPGGR